MTFDVIEFVMWRKKKKKDSPCSVSFLQLTHGTPDSFSPLSP